MSTLDFSEIAAAFAARSGVGAAGEGKTKDCFPKEQAYEQAKAELSAAEADERSRARACDYAQRDYAHAVREGDAAKIRDYYERWQTAYKEWKKADEKVAEKQQKVHDKYDGVANCYAKAYKP